MLQKHLNRLKIKIAIVMVLPFLMGFLFGSVRVSSLSMVLFVILTFLMMLALLNLLNTMHRS